LINTIQGFRGLVYDKGVSRQTEIYNLTPCVFCHSKLDLESRSFVGDATHKHHQRRKR